VNCVFAEIDVFGGVARSNCGRTFVDCDGSVIYLAVTRIGGS
jgi:hypothetical protein